MKFLVIYSDIASHNFLHERSPALQLSFSTDINLYSFWYGYGPSSQYIRDTRFILSLDFSRCYSKTYFFNKSGKVSISIFFLVMCWYHVFVIKSYDLWTSNDPYFMKSLICARSNIKRCPVSLLTWNLIVRY